MNMVGYIYAVRTPSVVSEIIDGEAIIMDMSSGLYFSGGGTACLIWQAILDGLSHDQILANAMAAYPDDPQAPREIEEFLADAQSRGLISRRPSTSDQPHQSGAWSGAWRTPQLTSHEDMQDLIQLDPIHDVDEVGWPVRKAPD